MIATLGLLAGWALPILGGLGLTRLLGWPQPTTPIAGSARLAVSALLGIGVASLLTFGWFLAGGLPGPGYVAADVTLFLGLTAASWFRGRPSSASATSTWRDRTASVAFGALLVGVVAAVLALLFISRATPHGESDAWMMWTMRARFLGRAGEAWRVAFSPELGWTSTEYPLLLPLAIVRLWTFGGEGTLAPALLASTFTLCGPLALAGAVSDRGGSIRGAIAGLLLLGSPGWTSLGGSQYADVPVASFLVAGVGLLAGTVPIAGRLPLGKLVGAGFLLGLAGWTKNEGVAAAAIAVLVFAGARTTAAGARIAASELLGVVAGAALPATAWLLFHEFVMPRVAGVLFAGNSLQTLLSRLADGGRWNIILGGLGRGIPGVGGGFPVAVLAIAVALAMRERRAPTTPALAVPALLFLTYVGVFMTTSWDLEWHVRLSADRLVLQAWPLVLLGLLTPARVPARAADGS